MRIKVLDIESDVNFLARVGGKGYYLSDYLSFL